MTFQFDTQLSQDTNKLGPCQRSHGLHLEPGTAANRAEIGLMFDFTVSVALCFSLNTARLAAVPGSKRNPC